MFGGALMVRVITAYVDGHKENFLI